jgi:hypothetical protein
MSLARIPSEVSLDWVYFPPLMIAVLLGFLAAYAVTRALNAIGLSRYFWNPGLALLAFWVLMTSLIGLFFIPT